MESMQLDVSQQIMRDRMENLVQEMTMKCYEKCCPGPPGNSTCLRSILIGVARLYAWWCKHPCILYIAIGYKLDMKQKRCLDGCTDRFSAERALVNIHDLEALHGPFVRECKQPLKVKNAYNFVLGWFHSSE